ncbi:pseudouridine synthase [Earliella scabrosa]|nr:pseudouridine synthase [Earliella scabrosa]
MTSISRSLPRSLKLKAPKPSVPTATSGPSRTPDYRLPPETVLLYADRGMVVINKPRGLISQLADPQNKRMGPSVDAEIFSTLLEDLRERLGVQQPLRTIHRLDKHTTGALALACSVETAREYSRQLSRGQAQKTYLALVCGDASAFRSKSGVIETKLECRDGRVRIPGVTGVYEREFVKPNPTGALRGEDWTKDAVTEYEVVASSSKVPLSLLRLQLLTGVKHQLRVHLAQHLRTPILGDTYYMHPRYRLLREIKKRFPIPDRLYLHASQFSLLRYHPSQVRLTIGAPLPEEFVNVCHSAGIPLNLDATMGGVWVDDTQVRGAEIVSPENRGAQVEDVVQQLRGKWYGPSRSP